MTITVEDLVHREVIYCVSHLVHTLAQHSYGEKGELLELCEQAIEAYSTVLDWEEPLIQEGWAFNANDDGWIRKVNGRVVETSFKSAEELCDQESLEPYENEIFEHWIVSDWLADALEAKGGLIVRDMGGMTIWGRSCTGQGIASDWVIQEIHRDLTTRKAA